MKKALNIAVIGLGRMGRIYSRVLATQVRNVRLHVVADPDPKAIIDVTNAFDVPNVLTEAEEAITLPGVHAVVIATPTHAHRDLVIAAAEAGKAIFCEKPLALTLKATREMLAAVERYAVPFQVGFMRRFDPAYRKARDCIRRGEIGQPVLFKSVGRDPRCPDPAFADPAHSGGLILDMGIHDFDLARWLMGSEVERVTAEGTLMVCEALRAVNDLDNAVVNLRFTNGAIGNVDLSRNAVYGYDVRTEVVGAKGAVRVGPEVPPKASILLKGEERNGTPYLVRRFGEAYRAQMQHFVACLRREEPPTVTGADALAAFEIGLAATYAARTGTPVTLDAVRDGWRPDIPNRQRIDAEVRI